MSRKSDLFWGLIIGLVGNLLVSTAFALVEHPEWSQFLNPVYILSWIAFVVFCLALLFTKDRSKKEESEEVDTVRNQENPDPPSLIAEYRILNEAIWRRDQVSLLVSSIMISVTLGIVTFAIRFRGELGRSILFDLPNAGFIPLVSVMLILIPYLLWWTSTKLDGICFNRIHEIEDMLHIRGHTHILEQIRCNTWYKFRRHMWHFIFLLFIGIYLFMAYWLFTKTIIT